METTKGIKISKYTKVLGKNRLLVYASGHDNTPCIEAKEMARRFFGKLSIIWGVEHSVSESATDAVAQYDFEDKEQMSAFVTMILCISNVVLSNI